MEHVAGKIRLCASFVYFKYLVVEVSALREALAEPQQEENPGDCSKWLFCLFFVEKSLLRSYVCPVGDLDPEPLVQQKE